MSETVHFTKDFVSGAISGAFGTSIGHPLDTIKLRLQIQPTPPIYKGALDCFAKTIQHEGSRGLLKGVVSPVTGSAPINALAFASNSIFNKAMKDYTINSTLKTFLSGCFAGLVCCSVSVPVELLKCQSQANTLKPIPYNKLIIDILKKKGITGLYKGWWVTFCRDVPCYGSYFLTYAVIKNYLSDQNGNSSYMAKLLAGGFAGVAGWISTYPFDIVKSIIQCNDSYKTPRMIDVFKSNYEKHGIRFFYRGIGLTLLRAFPVNAVNFIVYEHIAYNIL